MRKTQILYFHLVAGATKDLLVSAGRLTMTAVFIVLFWKGKVLFLIAGNTYIPEEEKGSLAQRRLGKQTSVALVFSLSIPLALILTALISLFDISAFVPFRGLIVWAGFWITVIACTILMVVTCYDAAKRKRD